VIIQTGTPREPGTYAVRRHYLWEIAEWRDGVWCSGGMQTPLPKTMQAEIESFIGPLPKISRDFSVPAAEPEYDL
jgi:hypothetical protein